MWMKELSTEHVDKSLRRHGHDLKHLPSLSKGLITKKDLKVLVQKLRVRADTTTRNSMIRGLKPFHMRALELDEKKEVRKAGFPLICSSHSPKHLSRHLTRKIVAYIRVIFQEAAPCHKTTDLLKDPLLLHRVYSESLTQCIENNMVPHVTRKKMIKMGVVVKRRFQRFTSRKVVTMLCTRRSNTPKVPDIALCTIVQKHSPLTFKPVSGCPCAMSFYDLAFLALQSINSLPEGAASSSEQIQNITLNYVSNHP